MQPRQRWQGSRTAYTHRQVLQAEVVEHVLIRLLELGQVDVLFEGLVLRAQLAMASHDMDASVERRRGQATHRLGRNCKLRVKRVQTVHNLLHDGVIVGRERVGTYALRQP